EFVPAVLGQRRACDCFVATNPALTIPEQAAILINLPAIFVSVLIARNLPQFVFGTTTVALVAALWFVIGWWCDSQLKLKMRPAKNLSVLRKGIRVAAAIFWALLLVVTLQVAAYSTSGHQARFATGVLLWVALILAMSVTGVIRSRRNRIET